MSNNIKIVNEAHTSYLFSVVEQEEVCIIEYNNDKQFSWISFNVAYTNRDRIRSSHYTAGLKALLDDRLPIYTYALAIYKKVKALDKRLIDDGTMSLGDYDYGNAVIKWLGKPFHSLNHTRNKADEHMARDYDIKKFLV